MKIIITGIAGHLGSSLARYLLAHHPSATIIGIDDLSCGYPENIPPGITNHKITLGSNFLSYRAAEIFADADYVFHFAAYAAEGLSPFIRRFDCRSNLLSTIEIINACLNAQTVKRIIFTSSMAVYGHGSGPAPFDETYHRQPIDPYGISKSACEQHLEVAAAQHGQDYCIIRPHNLYGPGQSGWQVFRNVLGNWMVRTLQGQPKLVYGGGEQCRAFSYIDDVVPCFWTAANSPQASRQIINLGGTHPTRLRDLAELTTEICGGTWESAPARHEVKTAYCTTAKSEELLGYTDRTSLEVGIERMWDWMRDAWERYPQRRGTQRVAAVEVERGLYPFWREYVGLEQGQLA